MKNIINNFLNFIHSLSVMDIMFLIAIICLLILIVSLIYIMKLNNDDLDVEDYEDDDVISENNEDCDELDLVKLTKEIENKENSPIYLNDYEKEQEEKAIISYDELVASQRNNNISYKNEQDLGGLKVKSVDIDYLTRPISILKDNEIIKPDKDKQENSNPVLISYDKEEAFLETLKKMKQLLN